MSFPLGKPIFVMIGLAVVAGSIAALTRRADTRADLELWCFSEQNWKAMTRVTPGQSESLQVRFEKASGLSTAITIVQMRALNTRLGSLFMNGTTGPELPDLVDVEIGYVGRYFRPPLDQVGFLPLDRFLERDNWTDKLLKNRLATWSKDGVIFGIPQDVHPVVLVYNDDMYKQAGIDLATCTTWTQFIECSLQFQSYWRQQGRPRVWSLEVTDSSASTIVQLLLQRGVNLVDEHQQLHFTDEKTLDTLVTVCRMLAGPQRIAASTSGTNETYSQDLGSGYVNALLCADWRLKYIKDNAPADFAGKLRVMPLPAWPDSPYRTSTFGGSMVGIPRNARDPEASWKMIQALYLSDDAAKARTQSTYILPPVKTAWTNPAYDAPDPYFSGQPVKRILASLAADVPPRYVTPASTAAEVELANVLIRALRIATTADEATLRDACRGLLADAQTRVQRQIEHGRFDE